jgi:hypothetical protein
MSPAPDGTSPITLDCFGDYIPEPGDVLHDIDTRGAPALLVVAKRIVRRRTPAPGVVRCALRVVRNPPAEDIDPDALHTTITKRGRRR